MTSVMTPEAIIATNTQSSVVRPTERNSVGIQRLLHLLSLVDRPWFRDRHNVQFTLETGGDGPVLRIARHAGPPIARWVARGETLVFTNAIGDELRAQTLACAVSITCEALDHSRGRRN
jgi:hypothetical protein